MGATSKRCEDGDGRQGQVDGPDPDHEAHEAPRRDTEAHAVPQSRAAEIECELGDERQRIDQEVSRCRLRLAGRDEDERRTDGVPGIHEPQDAAGNRDAAARVVRQAAEKQTCHDAERHVLHGKQGEHRHQDELRGHGRPCPDLEVDSRGERIRGHEDDKRPEAHLPGRVSD